MHVSLRARPLRLTALLLLLFFVAASASATSTLMLKAGTLPVRQIQANGSLLATFPAAPLSRVNLPAQALQVAMSYPVWNENRGIYHTGIPGIGFSFCTQEGSGCLHNGSAYRLDPAGEGIKNFAIRLYKTGDVQAGDYDLPALFTLSLNEAPLLAPGLSALRLNVSQCSVTRENLRVTFPDAVISAAPVLSRVSFHLPVSCKNAADYDNLAIHFSFNGTRPDAQHIATSLPGISLRVKNEEGRYVDFSAPATGQNARFHDTDYVAELTRNPGEQPAAGTFVVSITAEVELR